MKILIIGANSYLGARLYYDLKDNYEVTGTFSHNQFSKEFIKLDITNKTEVTKTITEVKPDVIIHAANNANARWCEANPEEAKKLNLTSTKDIVDAAIAINAKIIYISSFAAIRPINVYGQTKQGSEQIIIENTKEYTIIRPSLIMGYSPNTTNDRPFNRILKNIDEKTPAEYDTSWHFQPTYIGQISKIIEKVINDNIWRTIIPVACENLTTRYELAVDILSPFDIKVKPIDNHDTQSNFKEDLSVLNKLNLPQYSYAEMIDEIIQEIKNRKKFILN